MSVQKSWDELQTMARAARLVITTLDVLVLTPEVIHDTLGTLLKYQDDIAKIQGSEAANILREISMKAEAARR